MSTDLILCHDLGWAEVGFHRTQTEPHGVRTPVLDSLAREGLRLERLYVHKICSPTRCSFQVGLPVPS